MKMKHNQKHAQIGTFLRTLRLEKNLTEKDVAEALGVTERVIHQWEKGTYLPEITLLQPLANLYNVSTEDIINGSISSDSEGEERTTTDPQFFEYAATSSIEQQDVSRKKWFSLVSLVLLIVIASCMLIDFLTIGRFTWSLIVLISIGFAWGSIIPIFIMKKQPILTSMVTMSILTIPYLYLLDNVLSLDGILIRIAIPVAVAAYFYLWGLYVVYRYYDFPWIRIGMVAAFGGAILSAVINFVVSYNLDRPFFTVWNILSIVILVAIGVGLIFYERQKKTTPPE
ncbi:helix-turn-helix domain-containing protein [Fundicoccus culcitae]|uniref:Helix-turn-helix transcriptional regulator n=1 Tax=Fundicoccus culcitae TaxID=2969821 RepID=A0ABY5P573_9LACT|nr:helix-turn-helix domain-containing protein [Fundicoccus culcitae]UUX33892.1 helix-turn-helix transcriptional regulator [Fundicoccus culcitae]